MKNDEKWDEMRSEITFFVELSCFSCPVLWGCAGLLTHTTNTDVAVSPAWTAPEYAIFKQSVQIRCPQNRIVWPRVPGDSWSYHRAKTVRSMAQIDTLVNQRSVSLHPSFKTAHNWMTLNQPGRQSQRTNNTTCVSNSRFEQHSPKVPGHCFLNTLR